MRPSKSAHDTSGSCRECCAERAAQPPEVSQYGGDEAGWAGAVVVCSLQGFLVVQLFNTLHCYKFEVNLAICQPLKA